VNVKISSVPDNKGIEDWVLVTTTALATALALACPYPINTVTLPLLMMRYWLPPRVVDAACTEVVGELAVAVKVIVFPIGVKA
jgi:hypothetical protein